MNSLILTITILFTQTYRDRYDVNWTSHQAKLVHNLVVDQKYSYGPMKLNAWTDLFNLDKRPCKQIENMTQFDEYSDESCFLIIDNP